MNEDSVLNYRQFPLPFERNSESIMVGGIIKLFKPLISELETISRPETLQGLLSEVRLIKNNLFSSVKQSRGEGVFPSTRKAIRSFY